MFRVEIICKLEDFELKNDVKSNILEIDIESLIAKAQKRP